MPDISISLYPKINNVPKAGTMVAPVVPAEAGESLEPPSSRSAE